jgi:phage-related protein
MSQQNARYLAQTGAKHPDAKPLKDFGRAGVLEVPVDTEGKTYRVIYTVIFPNAVYVLHAFRKKAKWGIATPRQDLALIRARLQRAQAHSEQEGASNT